LHSGSFCHLFLTVRPLWPRLLCHAAMA
jgi:hypothetical protein